MNTLETGSARSEATRSVLTLAKKVGYVDCGVAPEDGFRAFAAALDSRIVMFPDLAGLYEPMRNRADPMKRNPWAKSVVVCLRLYGKYRIPEQAKEHIGRNYLCDRRYEENPDHGMTRAMTAGLKALGMRAARGSVPDRMSAQLAGIASIGRNGFAYSKEHGSWVNIETWLVDADLVPGQPSTDCPCPPDCRACMDACPTGAIVEPFVMRMDRCVAWLTYQAPEPLDPGLEKRMGGWVYGCDVCQEMCPLNSGKWNDSEPMPWMDEVAESLSPASLAVMDQETYERAIMKRFWYIPEDGLSRWQTNARRALTNEESTKERPR